MDIVQIIGQGLMVALLARLVYQIGHLTGTVDSVVSRLGSLENWRDARRPQV